MEQTSSRKRRIGDTDDPLTAASRREDVTPIRGSATRRGSSVRCRAAPDVQMADSARRHGDRPTEDSQIEDNLRTTAEFVVGENAAATVVVFQRALIQLLCLRDVPRHLRHRPTMVADRDLDTRYFDCRRLSNVLDRILFRSNSLPPLPVPVEPPRPLWHPRLHTPEWIESQLRPSECTENDSSGH